MRCGTYLLAVVTLVLPAASALADTLITHELQSQGMTLSIASDEQKQGPPAKESRIWLGQERGRFDELRKSVILRRDLGKVYFVDHSRRSYVEASWPAKLADLVDPSIAASVKEGKASPGGRATLAPSDERRAIEKWRCRRYDAVLDGAGMHVTKTLWVTQDIDVDRELFADLLRAAALAEPLGGSLLVKLADVGGVPIAEESNISASGMTLTNRRKVVSVREVTPPANNYAPPDDYRRVDYLYRTLRELGLR